MAKLSPKAEQIAPTGSSLSGLGREELPSGTSKKLLSHDTVATLSQMIKDLEEQLERMLAINEALESELTQERGRRHELDKVVEGLREQLRHAEKDSSTIDDLQAEINHLNGERARLSTTIEELGRHLSETEQENHKLSRQAGRLQAERDDTLEELQGVEGQFNRAMEMVSDLRTRLAVLAEERDALKSSLKATDEKLLLTEEERDSLLAEVNESRNALEDIRRSLVDACVLTQRRPDE